MRKKQGSFFPKESVIHPHYIQIIFTFYSSIGYYNPKKYGLYPKKLHCKQGRNASQFLKKLLLVAGYNPGCVLNIY